MVGVSMVYSRRPALRKQQTGPKAKESGLRTHKDLICFFKLNSGTALLINSGILLAIACRILFFTPHDYQRLGLQKMITVGLFIVVDFRISGSHEMAFIPLISTGNGVFYPMLQ